MTIYMKIVLKIILDRTIVFLGKALILKAAKVKDRTEICKREYLPPVSDSAQQPMATPCVEDASGLRTRSWTGIGMTTIRRVPC